MEKMHRAKAPMLSLSMLNKCFLKEGRCEKTPSTGQFERVKFSLTFLHFYLEKSSYDTVNFLTSKINLGNFLPVFLLQSQPFDLVAGEYRIRIFHSYLGAHACWILSDEVFFFCLFAFLNKIKRPCFEKTHQIFWLSHQTISHPLFYVARKWKILLLRVKRCDKTPTFCHNHIVFITVACF